MKIGQCLIGIALLAVPSIAVAQSPELASSSTAQDTTCCVLPALTEVEIEIAAELSSKTSKSGEFFPIRLATPISVDGKILVPSGATGEGEVIQASKPSFGGKSGELTIAARFLSFDGVRIGLRSLQYSRTTGTNNSGEAVSIGATAAGAGIVAPLAGPAGAVVAMLIVGGNVRISAGTKAFAKTSTTISLPEYVASQTKQNEGGNQP